MKRLVPCLLAAVFFFCSRLSPEAAEEEKYFGSEAIADGKGSVDVKVVYFASEKCWQIKSIREGVPDKAADQPAERHLYVTVNITKTGERLLPDE